MSLPFVIEPRELAGLLAQPAAQKLLILDLCRDSQYAAGHIDSAIHVPPQKIVAGTHPYPGKIASASQLSRVFSFLGLTPDTHVVVYDDEGGAWAGRMIWTLDVIGHKHVSYLNGGLHAWVESGLPLSKEPPVVTSVERQFTIDNQQVIEIADILNSFDRADSLIWDARSPAEFLGDRITASRNGHMPRAVNVEWTELIDFNQGMRIRKDAREYLAERGITQNKQIITHCHSHHRSGFTYLVGRALGLNIKAYHGGWAEWGDQPNTPIESPRTQEAV